MAHKGDLTVRINLPILKLCINLINLGSIYIAIGIAAAINQIKVSNTTCTFIS